MTTWCLQALTVFGAFVLVLRSRTPFDVGAVLVVAVLATAVLWRVDLLHARGRVDKPLVLLVVLVFVALAGMNLLLSGQIDEEIADRERLMASVRSGREDIAELEEENEELRRQVAAMPADPPSGEGDDDAIPPSTTRPTNTSSTTSPRAGASPDVVQSGSYELWGGGSRYFDLDAWEEWSSIVDAVDLIVADGTFSTANGVEMSPVSDAAYTSCLSATGWTTYVHLEDVVVGGHYCVKTSADHLALLEVTGVNEQLTDQLYFVGTVWDPT